MNTQPPNARPRFTPLEVFLVLVLFFMFIRITAILALIALALLYAFFPLHRSRRALIVAFCVFVAALLIPVDIHIPWFHGPITNSKHSGLRFVRVLYGLGAHFTDGRESISGGCVVGVHDTRWKLVWD